MGAVTPMGIGVDAAWAATVAGESGISRITLFDAADLPCQIGGEIPEFKASDYMNRRDARRMSRASQLAVAAWRMAAADAGLDTLTDPERAGVQIGSSFGGLDKLDESLDVYRRKGWAKVNPFALTSTLANMPTYHISVESGAQGPIGTQVAACASGVQGVGEGAELIWRGAADIVFAGGVDACVHPAAFAGFCAMRALPVNYNDDPTRASRPFDAAREGFLLSEGSAVLVLEALDHALARGATIYAEVLGQASAADAHHMAAPDPNAGGATRAMKWALQRANLAPEAVDYINAHGPSTPLNGRIETRAIKNLFGDHAYDVAISSTKSVMGHAMGGSGAIEAVLCVQALRTGIVPPTINYETADPDCDLDYVPNIARQINPQIALCNAFGLGGQNACLVLRSYTLGS